MFCAPLSAHRHLFVLPELLFLSSASSHITIFLSASPDFFYLTLLCNYPCFFPSCLPFSHPPTSLFSSSCFYFSASRLSLILVVHLPLSLNLSSYVPLCTLLSSRPFPSSSHPHIPLSLPMLFCCHISFQSWHKFTPPGEQQNINGSQK